MFYNPRIPFHPAGTCGEVRTFQVEGKATGDLGCPVSTGDALDSGRSGKIVFYAFDLPYLNALDLGEVLL